MFNKSADMISSIFPGGSRKNVNHNAVFAVMCIYFQLTTKLFIFIHIMA